MAHTLRQDVSLQRTAASPPFELRFPIAELRLWADRYDYADDAAAEAAGRAARARGWYSREEFLTVTNWKTPRSRRHHEANTERAIADGTRLALRTADERLRIGALTLLQGVEPPTASVLLHLAHADRYPILDLRALWATGLDVLPNNYSFLFWVAFTGFCRSVAHEARVDMRTLDRALWEYSEVNQPRSGP